MSTAWYGFVNDTKPYHCKLAETVVEYQYDDPMTVIMTDQSAMNIVLSSVWGKDNNNIRNKAKLYTSWSASDLSDSTMKYLQFRLPATVFPRFSKDSYIKYEFNGADDEEYKDLSLTESYVILHKSNVISSSDITGPRLQGYDTSGIEDDPDFDGDDIFDANEGKSFTFDVDYEMVLQYEQGFQITNFYVQGIEKLLGTDFSIDPDGVTVRYKSSMHIVLDTFTTFAGFNLLTDSGDLNKQLADSIIKIKLQQIMMPRAFSRDYGCYPVPFHHGSQIKVNGVIKTFGVDYVVGKMRKTIKFLDGHKPQKGDKIEINLFFSDRFFISINDDWKEYYIVPHTHTYATIGNFDIELPSDAGDGPYDQTNPTPQEQGLIDAFTGIDRVPVGGVDDADHLMWTFFDITKPYYKDMFISGAIDLAGFDVTGYSAPSYQAMDSKFDSLSWTRDKNYLTIKHLYHGKAPKDLISVSIPSLGILGSMLQIVAVTDSEIVLDIIDSGPTSGDDCSYEYLYIYNLSEDIQTVIEPYGSIKKAFDDNGDGYYVFEWNEIPPLNTKFEFRIEQHDQYNNWVVNGFKEDVHFYELLRMTDTCIVDSNDSTAGDKEYDEFDFGTLPYDDGSIDYHGRKSDDMQIIFTEKTPTNIGNGNVKNISVSGGFESITLQAVSGTKFRVTGSVSGEMQDRAEVNKPFTIGSVTFTIVSGTINFKANDSFKIQNYLFIDMDRQASLIRQATPVNKLIIKHNKYGTPSVNVYDYDTDDEITPTTVEFKSEDLIIYFESAKTCDILISSETA